MVKLYLSPIPRKSCSAMKIISRSINNDQLSQQINIITNYLQPEGIVNVSAYWGWDCNLDTELLWKPEIIPVSKFQDFINSGISQEIYSMNQSDVFLEDVDQNFRFKFCHESDIHLETTDKKLFEFMKENWKEHGLL